MTTIANRKFSEMVQLEFQNSGSSSVSAMLLQPLLDKASTFICELTDLQVSLNEELAFPEDMWLFSIVRKPVVPDQIHNNHEGYISLRTDLLKQYVKDYNAGNYDTPFAEYEMFGTFLADPDNPPAAGDPAANPPIPADTALEAWTAESMYWEDDTDVNNPVEVYVEEWDEMRVGQPQVNLLNPQMIYYQDEHPYKYEELVVKTRKYFSALDFIQDVAHQVDMWDRTVSGDHIVPVVDWYTQPVDNLIKLSTDASGRISFVCEAEFCNNYMIVFSKLFQTLTGLPELIYNDDAFAFPNNTACFTFERLQTLQEAEHSTAAPVQWFFDTDDIAINVNPGSVTEVQRYSSTTHSILDGFDVRRVLAVEVSLPIPHTLAWDGTKESTRFVLQEFQISGGAITSKYIYDDTYPTVQLRETQKMGPMIFLNGGSNMALKKLYEGQLQAIRIDLVLQYDEWDRNAEAFVRKSKRLDMSPADFFYLKLLFSKETL